MFIAHVWAAVWPSMPPGQKDPKEEVRLCLTIFFRHHNWQLYFSACWEVPQKETKKRLAEAFPYIFAASAISFLLLKFFPQYLVAGSSGRGASECSERVGPGVCLGCCLTESSVSTAWFFQGWEWVGSGTPRFPFELFDWQWRRSMWSENSCWLESPGEAAGLFACCYMSECIFLIVFIFWPQYYYKLAVTSRRPKSMPTGPSSAKSSASVPHGCVRLVDVGNNLMSGGWFFCLPGLMAFWWTSLRRQWMQLRWFWEGCYKVCMFHCPYISGYCYKLAGLLHPRHCALRGLAKCWDLSFCFCDPCVEMWLCGFRIDLDPWAGKSKGELHGKNALCMCMLLGWNDVGLHCGIVFLVCVFVSYIVVVWGRSWWLHGLCPTKMRCTCFSSCVPFTPSTLLLLRWPTFCTMVWASDSVMTCSHTHATHAIHTWHDQKAFIHAWHD